MITDFGLAKTGAAGAGVSITGTGDIVGTPAYMAPEQLEGGVVGPPADLYALGVVMYEVITGRRPFNAAGLDLLTEQLTLQPAPPSALAAVPAAVDAILSRCLAPDLDDRFASASALVRALDETLAAEPSPPRLEVRPAPRVVLPAAPPAEEHREQAPVRMERPRSRRVIALAAVGVLAIAIAVALALGFS